MVICVFLRQVDIIINFLKILLFISLGLVSIAKANICLEKTNRLITAEENLKNQRHITINNISRNWIEVGNDSVVALRNGIEVQSGIHEIIKAAKKTIYIEVNGLGNKTITTLLREKSKAGIDVKILMSDIRNYYIEKEVKEEYLTTLENLKADGIEIQFHREYSLIGSTQLFGENHKKIIIVDGQYGYIGTSNIRQYFNNYDHGLILKGDYVKKFSNAFARDYYQATARYMRLKSSQSNDAFLLFSAKKLKRKLIEKIKTAKESIVLVAYNLQSKDVIGALIDQKLKYPELSVKVLLGPSQSNFTLLGFLKSSRPMNHEAYRALKEVGAMVRWGGPHLKESGSIIHAKTIVIDNKYVFSGSSDFNSRSFEGNKELSFMINSRELADEFSNSILSEFKRGHDELEVSRYTPFKEKIIDIAGESAAFVRNILSSAPSDDPISSIDNILDKSRVIEKINKDGKTQKYYPDNRFFRDISDGSIIEGSHRYGGIQPDYYIDLHEAPIRSVLQFAEKIGRDPNIENFTKVNIILKHIQKSVLTDKNPRGAPYLEMLAKKLNNGEQVSISNYIEKHIGVCREHAILTHLALKKANIKNYFAYGVLKNRFGARYDHAFVIIDDGDEQWLVDSYNPYLNGRRLKDVLRSSGSKIGDPIASFASRLDSTLGNLGGIQVIPLNYPIVWKPALIKN